MSPASPTSPVASNESKPKKSNPLIDLIETEKLYVDQLTGIIRVGSKPFAPHATLNGWKPNRKLLPRGPDRTYLPPTSTACSGVLKACTSRTDHYIR